MSCSTIKLNYHVKRR